MIILDVVLGHGADADPARTLAPACESAMADGGPQVVAYVLGTDQDPQGYQAQRDRLVQAGCIVTETAARASLVAAAIATGDPSLARIRHCEHRPARTDEPRVALVTYSTKARGGVVHTLSLADAMADRAMPVRIVALGNS